MKYNKVQRSTTTLLLAKVALGGFEGRIRLEVDKWSYNPPACCQLLNKNLRTQKNRIGMNYEKFIYLKR